MTYKELTDDKLLQTLKDAGCTDKMIKSFMDLYRSQSVFQQKKVLAVHRQGLLDKIHQQQKMLDCLDYLIYQLNRLQDDKGRNKQPSLGL